MLISIVGTLITDNLTDNFGVSLVTTTIVFAVLLAATFAVWYASERTLSIHTIVTTRREAFYWLAVLFTFALGTAAGDLTAERLAVGYWQSALLFGALIAAVYVAHVRFALNAILAFWIAYILTRPLGASIGDYLSQPRADGGLGLGTTVTSVVFLLTILAVVVFLTITKRDTIESEPRCRRSTLPVWLASSSSPTRRTRPRRSSTAVRQRAAAGPAEFVVLVPNPAHLAFDRIDQDTHEGEEVLAQALPALEQAGRGRGPGPRRSRAPTRSTTSSRSSAGGATARSSSRRFQPRVALAAPGPPQATRPSRLPADHGHGDALAAGCREALFRRLSDGRAHDRRHGDTTPRSCSVASTPGGGVPHVHRG